MIFILNFKPTHFHFLRHSGLFLTEPVREASDGYGGRRATNGLP